MDNQNETVENQPNLQNSFGITEPMILSLRQTKPWVKIMSIIGFISMGFMVIAGAINMFTFSKLSSETTPLPIVFIGVINILMGLLYFFPSLYLYKFSASISRLLEGGGLVEMEEALTNQKSFWKFVGILTLIMFGFALVGIVAAIIIPQLVSRAGQ